MYVQGDSRVLSKRIIPCLDVKEGRVVKGIKFKDHRDVGDPVELAKYYDSEGADELVFYDITASSDNRNIIYDVVKRCLINHCIHEIGEIIYITYFNVVYLLQIFFFYFIPDRLWNITSRCS